MENYNKDKVGDWKDHEAVLTKEHACENPLCKSKLKLTKHHLIPKAARRLLGVTQDPVLWKDTMVLCEKCHVKLHRLKTNRQLAKNFNCPDKVVNLLEEWHNRSSYEILNKMKFPVYVEVFEGSNMWN